MTSESVGDADDEEDGNARVRDDDGEQPEDLPADEGLRDGEPRRVGEHMADDRGGEVEREADQPEVEARAVMARERVDRRPAEEEQVEQPEYLPAQTQTQAHTPERPWRPPGRWGSGARRRREEGRQKGDRVGTHEHTRLSRTPRKEGVDNPPRSALSSAHA